MSYPTELVAKAKYEMHVFERVSADTAAELIAEVVMLRSLIRDMRTTALSGSRDDLQKVVTESLFSVPQEV